MTRAHAPLAALLPLVLFACAGGEPAASSTSARPHASTPAPSAAPPAEASPADALLRRAEEALAQGFLLRAEARADRALALYCGGKASPCPEAPIEARETRTRIARALDNMEGDAPAGLAPSQRPEEDARAAAAAFAGGRVDEAARLAFAVAAGPRGEDATNAFVILARLAERGGDATRARRMYARGFRAWTGEKLLPVLPENDPWAAALKFPGLRPAPAEPVISDIGAKLLPDGSAVAEARGGVLRLWSISDRIQLDRIRLAGAQERVYFGEGKTRRAHIDASAKATLRALAQDGSWSEANVSLPGIEESLIFIAPEGSVFLPKIRSQQPLAIEWLRVVPGRPAPGRLPTPHPAFSPIPFPAGGLIGLDRGDVVVIDVATGKVQRRFARAHNAGATPELAVTADGTWLVADDATYGLVLLSLQTGQRKEIARSKEGRILGVFPEGAVLDAREGWSVLRFADASIEAVGVVQERTREVLGPGQVRLRIRESFDRGASMALDPEGYFEIRGERVEMLRRAASCGVGYPLELCADAFEREGVAERFAREDLSYREP